MQLYYSRLEEGKGVVGVDEKLKKKKKNVNTATSTWQHVDGLMFLQQKQTKT